MILEVVLVFKMGLFLANVPQKDVRLVDCGWHIPGKNTLTEWNHR